MKKMCTVFATGLLAFSAVAGAGSKCNATSTIILASDVVKLKSAKTVNGKDVMIKVSAKGVMVDAAWVVATDVERFNGILP